jgi:hypothetical protein
MTMENTFDQTTVETIELLEVRLRRIEYAVCGQVDEATLSNNKQPISKRLSELEHSLHQLASKSRVVQDLLRLRKYTPHTYGTAIDGGDVYRCQTP